MLAETGASCTIAMVDGHSMLVILDGGSYANIISKDFLDYIGNTDIAACDSQFMLADDCNTPCKGIVHGLELCIQGVVQKIDVVVFAHNQYNLLIGQKTLKDFMINTDYKNDHCTMRKDRNLMLLPILYMDPTSHLNPYLEADPVSLSFLYQELLDMLDFNSNLTMEQADTLYKLVCEFEDQLVKDQDQLPLTNTKPYTIVTGDAAPIFCPHTDSLNLVRIF
ncbi:hypothetical protein DSO57_1035434 [Entomophthora muscae]|uniref:Uncharacterized protein n=1 Tax=Entomophthora muscae TaxID=34485 RepID=A0ACC2SPC3_9FUNG|nr:hypothetical protein DSO57_1035434 [Entomophthora muscae]